ncbi:MAG: hypothetical protein V4805_07560 [Pseudomonadota bacterium]
MKTFRFAKLKVFWPEFILLPVFFASIYKLLEVSFVFPLSTLSQKLDIYIVQALILAGLVYMGAHVLRAARLSLLIGVGKLSFGAILGCHSLVSFLTFALPWKLGELVRVLEFYRLTRSDPRALLAIWLERCFDAVIVLSLIELASSAAFDASFAQITRRGLMVLLGLSIFVVLFGRSAVSALLRLLSSSTSMRSLRLMRLMRKIEAFVGHMPPLTSPNLALLFIVSCAIWVMEIAAVLIVIATTTGAKDNAVDALVELISTAVIGVGNSGASGVLIYRLLVSSSLALLSLGFARRYFQARKQAWPKDNRAEAYRFIARGAYAPDEQKMRVR